jgi:hypothetical protein
MSLRLLIEWWNLIYLVPFGLAILYLGVFVFTGITFGDADADADMDTDMDAPGPVHVEAHVVDADADADGDLDADADMDADADAEADTEADADNDAAASAVTHAHAVHAGDGHGAGGAGEGSFTSDLLSFLGLGKIPVSLALMILLLWWGMVGFMLNTLFFQWGVAPWLIGFATLPLTAVIAGGLTGGCAAILGKLFPGADSRAQRREDLVGRSGEAIFDIDGTFGMASVRNATGDLIQVACQTRDGESRIPKGSRVVLFNYDREKGVFHVAPFAA